MIAWSCALVQWRRLVAAKLVGLLGSIIPGGRDAARLGWRGWPQRTGSGRARSLAWIELQASNALGPALSHQHGQHRAPGSGSEALGAALDHEAAAQHASRRRSVVLGNEHDAVDGALRYPFA